MDRRSPVNGRRGQSRNDESHISRDRRANRRDARDQGHGDMISPKDYRHREELQNLLQEGLDGSKRPRGRSRSPRRQENRRNANRRNSPNRRVSWQDAVDSNNSATRNINQSPRGHRNEREPRVIRGRDNRTRNQPVKIHPSSSEQSFQLAKNHSHHKSRDEITMQHQSVGFHKSRRRSRSRSKSRSSSRSRGSSRSRSRSRSRGRSRSRSRSRSPHKKQKTFKEGNRKSPAKRRLRTTDPRVLDAESATVRLCVTSIALHALAIGTSLMVIVPMSLVSSRWQMVRRACPIYVHNNIGVTVDWGNPNMLVCYIIAYLPIVILALSICLLLFHYGIMHTWYTNKSPPAFALTRKHAVCTMLLVIVEATVAWCIACLLTDGFRQTCLSFELTPYPEDRPISCKYGFDDRDETYMFQDLNTFEKVMISMVGAWVCVIIFTILTVSFVVRACCCYST